MKTLKEKKSVPGSTAFNKEFHTKLLLYNKDKNNIIRIALSSILFSELHCGLSEGQTTSNSR